MPVTFQQNQYLFDHLREKFPVFHYRDFSVQLMHQGLHIRFEFSLGDQYHFHPDLTIPCQPVMSDKIDHNKLQNLAFHIGLIELVSYWKAACSPEVVIHCGKLDDAQISWWKEQYFRGLGEFFYTNGITTTQEQFMHLHSTSDSMKHPPFSLDTGQKCLVPVGGGKDSVVTLHMLKNAGIQVIPFILNPREASVMTVRAEGFEKSATLQFFRTLDPLLLKLNEEGFLNGHTPFSALLAFTSLLGAAITQSSYIILSNESSANEATIPGTLINHQYSKTYLFEKAFRQYVAEYITRDISYFSFLRPLNELQIARYFSKLTHQFPYFKSCNAGSKTNTWCGQCPKCLFTWIILAPFVEEKVLTEIFGVNILHNEKLIPLLEQLSGLSSTKPFECVGTIEEIHAALNEMLRIYPENDLPVLLRHLKESDKWKPNPPMDLRGLLSKENPEHFVPELFLEILRKEAVI